MSRLYTGFGYWDVTSWLLAFAVAVLRVSWIGGLGPRSAPPVRKAETAGAEEAKPFPDRRPSFWEDSSFHRLVGESPSRFWEILSAYRVGWALVAMVFLLVLALL